MLRAAVEQFIDKDAQTIQEVAMNTLEGHQRAIMGRMSVDEIFKDRKKFSAMVFDIATSDLYNMGIQVISYTLKDIKDEDQYMVSLGMARTAEIVRDARIGEAEASRDAQIAVAYAEEQVHLLICIVSLLYTIKFLYIASIILNFWYVYQHVHT